MTRHVSRRESGWTDLLRSVAERRGPQTVQCRKSGGLTQDQGSRSHRSLIIACSVFLLASLVAASLIVYLEHERLRHERTLASGYAKDHARHLEVYVDRAMSACYALAALIRSGNGNIPNFNQLAEQLLPFYPGASELVVSVGGTIRYVAPLKGNERAIGLDLLSDPGRKAEATITRQSGNSPSPARSTWLKVGWPWPGASPSSSMTPKVTRPSGDSR